MSTLPQTDETATPGEVPAGPLPRLGVIAFALSLAITLAQVGAFVFYLASGESIVYFLVPVLYPVFWVIISIATLASVVSSHIALSRVQKHGLPGRSRVVWALRLGYVNLFFVVACTALTFYVFWVFSSYHG